MVTKVIFGFQDPTATSATPASGRVTLQGVAPVMGDVVTTTRPVTVDLDKAGAAMVDWPASGPDEGVQITVQVTGYPSSPVTVAVPDQDSVTFTTLVQEHLLDPSTLTPSMDAQAAWDQVLAQVQASAADAAASQTAAGSSAAAASASAQSAAGSATTAAGHAADAQAAAATAVTSAATAGQKADAASTSAGGADTAASTAAASAQAAHTSETAASASAGTATTQATAAASSATAAAKSAEDAAQSAEDAAQSAQQAGGDPMVMYGTGSPLGVVTPYATGCTYTDTTPKSVGGGALGGVCGAYRWAATGPGKTDWVVIDGLARRNLGAIQDGVICTGGTFTLAITPAAYTLSAISMALTRTSGVIIPTANLPQPIQGHLFTAPISRANGLMGSVYNQSGQGITVVGSAVTAALAWAVTIHERWPGGWPTSLPGTAA